MAQPWTDTSAGACVNALLAQRHRKRSVEGAPRPIFPILAGLLFLLTFAIVAYQWGHNALPVWMLFLAPLLAGGAGAAHRPMVDRLRGSEAPVPALLATLVLGLVAGGMADLLFITAQLTADPALTDTADKIAAYAQRSIPWAVAIGFWRD